MSAVLFHQRVKGIKDTLRSVYGHLRTEHNLINTLLVENFEYLSQDNRKELSDILDDLSDVGDRLARFGRNYQPHPRPRNDSRPKF